MEMVQSDVVVVERKPSVLLPAAAVAAAALVVIGSLGPWVVVQSVFGSLTASGMDGDGRLTLVGALVAGGLAAASFVRAGRLFPVAAAVAFLLVALGGIYDWQNAQTVIDDNTSEYVTASVGWGLQLVVIAAIAGVAVCVARFLTPLTRQGRPRPPQ